MDSLYSTLSRDIVGNRKMLYELIITLVRRGIITSDDADRIMNMKEDKHE